VSWRIILLVNGDIKSLEIVAAAQLSGDKTLMDEIINKVDTHSVNQKTFGLPGGEEGRLIAKIFVFRLIYGGSSFSYANDPDFTRVSTSQKYWQGVIDAYYDKYRGIRRWHDSLLETVRLRGYIEIPSGRIFRFDPKQSWKGLEWPLTTIKNYPVQGLGADLVMLARIELMRLIEESGLEALLVMTVHDSLVLDCPSKNVDAVAQLVLEAVDKVPQLCYTNWSYKFSLPMSAEIKVGRTIGTLEKI
jgi:DNA polymerase-1